MSKLTEVLERTTPPPADMKKAARAAREPVAGDLKAAAALLAKHGRGGDTMLAHITPREVELLKRHGGAGTRNPKTGLLEYYDTEGGGQGVGGGAQGGTSPGTGDGGAGTGTGSGTGFGGGGLDAALSNMAGAPSGTAVGVAGTGLGGPGAVQAAGQAGAAIGGLQAGSVAPGAPATVEQGAALGFGNASQGLGNVAVDPSQAPGFFDPNRLAMGLFTSALLNAVPGGSIIGLGNTISGILGGPTIGGVLSEHGDPSQSTVGSPASPGGGAGGADQAEIYQILNGGR